MPAVAAPSSEPGIARPRLAGAVPDVWRLAWPAIGHMLLLTLVFTVDRVVLGRTDDAALASLQISTVVVWTLTSIFTAFSAATLAVAGRAFGAGDKQRAAEAITVSLACAGVLGAIVAAVALAAQDTLVAVAFPRAGEAVLRDVARYLRIALPILPFAFVEATAAAALQSTGDTRTPLVAAALSNALNLVTSCVLVFGLFGAPAMGVEGAALGAAGATVLQAALLLSILGAKKGPVPVAAVLRSVRAIDRTVVSCLARVSWPAFGDKLAYAGGYLVFVAFVATLGPAALASNQAILGVEAIAFLCAEGFGIAAGALVAQSLGARAPERAEHAARTAAAMSVLLLCGFGFVFAAAPRALLSAFTTDGHVPEAASTSLVLCAVAQPFMAYALVMKMALRGAGATRAVLGVTLAGTFLVRMPVVYFACVVGGWGLAGVWIASALDWVVEALVFGWLFHTGAWKDPLAVEAKP